MRIISTKVLREFWARHPLAEQQLRAWTQEVRKSKWCSPDELKKNFPGARTIGNNRAIFNICGGRYRLIVAVHYDRGIVFIRFVGAHSDYDGVDALTV